MKKFSCLISLILFLSVFGQAQTLRFFEIDIRNYPDSLNMFAATSDTAVLTVVDAQLALSESLRGKHINGPIDHGTGTNNPIYSWHFVTNQWALADLSIEVCDGRPWEDVENDTAYWIGTVGQFCPWVSFVKQEIQSTSIEANNEDLDIRISPNPFKNTIEINNQSNEKILSATLLNSLGQLIESHNSIELNKRAVINVATQPVGLYYLVIKMPTGFVVKQLVKY